MKIQNRQQFLLILTVAVLALYLGDLIIYGPLVKFWKSRQAQVNQLRQQVTQGKALVRRESVIRDDWTRMRQNALPNDSSQAEQQVLKALDSWAGDNSVTVNSVTPQWQNDQEDYSTLDCRVETAGDINSLSRFLYEIENSPMPLQLDSVELTATDDHGQQLSLGLQISGLALISPKP